MDRKNGFAVLVLAALVAVGVVRRCRKIEQPSVHFVPAADVPKAENATFVAVTYNAALAPGMNPLATPRVPYVAKSVAQLQFDALCLEEVWPDAAKDAVIAAMHLPADHVLVDKRAVAKGVPGDRCTADEIAPLERCVRTSCADVPTEMVTVCAEEHCEREGLDLYIRSKECLRCLAACVGQSADQIVDTCVTSGRGASLVYEGRNGVILASRKPLRNTEVIPLPSSDANRVALFATIDGYGSEPIEVACAHLSTLQPVPPSHAEFRDWTEEQIGQLRIVSRRLAERAGNRPMLFLGDMNFGTANAKAQEVSEGAWEEAVRLGFTSPGIAADPPLCSSCAGNTLRSVSSSFLLDHVLVRDPPGGSTLAPVFAINVFDDVVTIKGYDGAPVATNLSDHYGIAVKFVVK